jgi:TetR/AcrR family transcriptional regulator, lmrAB and yxaGH operons repressor
MDRVRGAEAAMGNAREQIIEATRGLLETQGYHATGLNQIVEESRSPKGSLYYYFPEGKEEIAAEAIERTGRVIQQVIRDRLAAVEDPAEAVRRFILELAQHVMASDCRGGGPITTVALETAASSDRLNAACREAYGLWQRAFEGKLLAGGIAPERASRLALLINASIEGAVILSRTNRTVEPLEALAEEIAGIVRREARG